MFGRKKKDPNAPKKVRFKTIRDAYSLARKHYKFVLLRCPMPSICLSASLAARHFIQNFLLAGNLQAHILNCMPRW